MAKKVYYEDRARDVLVTDEMARLGSDAKVWWIRTLDKAGTHTLLRIRWDVVLCAVLGGLLCEGCLIASDQAGAGVLLVFLIAVVGGLAIAALTANSYCVRVRTKKWMIHHALESADRNDIKVVVDAVNRAIKDYGRMYRLPPPRDDIPL